MLGRLADWFYDPIVFWGVPLVLAVAWAAVKWIRSRRRRTGMRR